MAVEMAEMMVGMMAVEMAEMMDEKMVEWRVALKAAYSVGSMAV